MCNVQVGYYLSAPLLMCRRYFIEQLHCWCAMTLLLNGCFACVQDSDYWHILLLVRISTIIELLFCLCALLFVSRPFFACVQRWNYWEIPLLLCNTSIIEFLHCLRAERRLLALSLACVKTDYRVFPLACVQWPTYWLSWLLVCKNWISFLLVCSNVLIEGMFCLGARFLLLAFKIVYVHIRNYWI